MKNERPFSKTIDQLKRFGATDLEAAQTVQMAVNRFTDKSNEIKKRLDEQATATARELNGKLVTLSTLLITVNGVFLSQKDIYTTLTSLQKGGIVVTFLLLIAAIVFGVMDYFQAGKFFRQWIEGSREVSRLVEKDISSGKIQRIGEMYTIESSVMNDLPSSSGDGYLKSQLCCTVLGTLGFVLIIASVLYDLPLIN